VKAIVVAHGEADEVDRSHLQGAGLVIAADGGALTCERWGILPHVVIGDLDSLGPERVSDLARRGATVEGRPAEKDESDTELAVGRAIAAGAEQVVLVGALGGLRLDHALANLLLLGDERYGGHVLRAVKGPVTVRALRGPDRIDLDGAPGDLVTLLAVGADAGGVRSEGLRYPLADETLHAGRSRGVSNVVAAVPAHVSCGSGLLLVIEIAAARGGGAAATGRGSPAG
jgi:thiamine pyrophosphokinase